MPKLITATALKLQKAQYYLQRMEATEHNPYYLDFICELESFLTHARSVTSLPEARKHKKAGYKDELYMEKEFGDRPGFTAWYEEKRKGFQKNSVLKFMQFMHNERNIIVHYNGQDIHVIHTTKVTFADNLSPSASLQTTPTQADGEDGISSSSEAIQPATENTHLFNTNEFTGSKAVIPACKQYFAILEKLMEECYSKGFA